MKKKYLHLTGGLGNQLFQLAAGLSCAGNDQLLISDKIGRPRTNSLGKPELFSFILPGNVKTIEKESKSKLVSKACGYVIRMGVSPRGFEQLHFVQGAIRLSASLVNSFFFRDIIKIAKVEGVGYSPIRKSSNMLIGYFQSYKYAEHSDVFEKLNQLRLGTTGQKSIELQSLAKTELPLVIHLRRGDYAQESSFGLLGANYYLSAVDIILKTSKVKSIWIFTDDLRAAENIFSEKFDLPIKFIDDVDGSAAASLEVMRHGKAFVIGNSSFSWWAAFLKYDTSAKVIAPQPWFIGQAEPNFLIPPSWKRVNGHHLLQDPPRVGM